MFDITSETRDNTSVIILKSRLTLQVILPARASLVIPSLIDDSFNGSSNVGALGMWSTPSLASLPGPPGSREVAPDKVLSMS